VTYLSKYKYFVLDRTWNSSAKSFSIIGRTLFLDLEEIRGTGDDHSIKITGETPVVSDALLNKEMEEAITQWDSTERLALGLGRLRDATY
jgi:hypothetical protein